MNQAACHQLLAQCPQEFTIEARYSAPVMTLPMPDGTFARFRIAESSIMAPELAARFPQIKTYCGQGIDDPSAIVRLDTTAAGLNAQVLSPQGAIYISSCSKAERGLHASYHEHDSRPSSAELVCATPPPSAPTAPALAVAGAPVLAPSPAAASASTGSTLRTYRLALTAMGEYTAYHGGTVEGAMAAMVSTVNQVNAIFERDLAIRLVLVANNHLIVYTNAETDPYTVPTDTSSRNAALAQNQANLDAVIGSANYDVGYLFGVGNIGGNNLFGTVCVSANKASGAMSASLMPEGRPFVLFSAHEIGHLFGAHHSYNGCGTGNGGTAFEPGSGSTLMCYSYAGGCGSADNLQPGGDSYFHSGNQDEVRAFVTTGNGTCGVVVQTGNHAPVVNAGPNFTIPKGTPFNLTATGSDEDGDAVTFCWEERDLGPAQPATGPGSADNGSSPLFRSFPPTNNPARTFPKLADILNNRATIGEQLPATSRTMRFRITARDNRAGGGGVSGADMQVAVMAGAGPFVVTLPNTNTSALRSGIQTVTWDVAGTTNAPVRATNVNILLSTDGGLSFPITLAANTPNDGAESISLPDVFTTEARIKIEAVGNIFFDISNPDFTIVPTAPVLVKVGASLLAEGCQPTNGVIDPGETVTIQTVFQNIGAADATGMAVMLLAAGGVLSPSPAQTNATARASGGFVTNAFTFTASADLPCGGTIVPTFQLQIGSTDGGTAAFSFPLGKTDLATTRVANTNLILISASSVSASPYPSRITVSGLPAVIGKITATLSNLTHPFPQDLDVLLVGPGGQAVLLMSDTSFGPANNATLTFDDGALFSLDEVIQPVSGVYTLTLIDQDFTPDVFPVPAPSGPYGRALSSFIGTDPNGTWRLYMIDLFLPDGGTIAGGWSLSITTSNTTCCEGFSQLRLTADLSNNDVRLRFTTQIGRTYLIERTDNLNGTLVWATVPGAGSVPGTGAIVEVIDTEAAQQRQRFYRGRVN